MRARQPAGDDEDPAQHVILGSLHVEDSFANFGHIGAGLGGQFVNRCEQPSVDRALSLQPTVGLHILDDFETGRLENRAMIRHLRRPVVGL